MKISKDLISEESYTSHKTTFVPANNDIPVSRKLILSSNGVTKFLFFVISCLSALHIVAVLMKYTTWGNLKFWKHFNIWFNLDLENNLPTLFSFLLLLIAASLLFFVFKTSNSKQTKYKYHWLGLSLIFFFLAFDEALQLHEELIGFIGPLYKNKVYGLLQMAWVIPYSILLIVVGGLYLKFLFSLPYQTKKWFIISGCIFVFGALITEFIEGYTFRNKLYITKDFIQFIQEFCELSGVALFIRAMINYISPNEKRLSIESNA